MFVTHLAGMWLCKVTHHILCWRYLGRFAEVSVRRRDGHVCWTNKRQGDTLEALEADRSCDIVHVKLRNMFTTVYKYQQHTPPDSQVSYRRLEEQLTAKDSMLQELRSVCSDRLPEASWLQLITTHTHTAA